MKCLFLPLLFLLSLLHAAAQTNAQQAAIIKAQRAASNRAIAKHDVEGIAKYRLPDFVQVRGNAIYIAGKDSIMFSWQQLFNNNPEVSFIRNPTEIIISKNDALAWEKVNGLASKPIAKAVTIQPCGA